MYDIQGFCKIAVIAKKEMLTHFSCLAFAEHNQGKQACVNGMVKCIFLLENITIFFKILTLIFILKYNCKPEDFLKL